jgi:hypothetical protein
MNEPTVFYPVKKLGLSLHIALGILLLTGMGVLIWLVFNSAAGALTVLYLFGAMVFLALFIFVAYRAYALMHASYTIERDGLSIRWGLRREDIPFTELEWIRPVGELTEELKPPLFAMPGAYLGASQHSDLGAVEFIASDTNTMVVIASFDRIMVLSPEQPEKFVNTFSRALEMGSISPIDAYSSQPAEFLRTVWSDRLARSLLIFSLVMTLLLVVVTSLVIPLQPSVSMGIDTAGNPYPAVASSRLLILPLLGTFALVMDVVVGLFLFRHENQRPVSYAIWSAAGLTPILFVAALFLMVF